MPVSLMPAPKDVRDLLTDLLGREVTVGPGDPLYTQPSWPIAVATYVDPQLDITAIALFDVPLAARAAGALALMPRGGIEESVKEKSLTPGQTEVLYEVANVMSAMFNAKGGRHSKLYALYAPGERIPGDIAGLASSRAQRLDIAVKIPGYGDGALAFVLP